MPYADPQTARAYAKEWAQKWRAKPDNRARSNASARKTYEKNATKYLANNRARTLKRKFGLTETQYDAMLEAQDGVCAICKQPETQTIRGTLARLHVDHDHVTGENRGLLCNRCNLLLGQVDDNDDLLTAAAVYLQRYQTTDNQET